MRPRLYGSGQRKQARPKKPIKAILSPPELENARQPVFAWSLRNKFHKVSCFAWDLMRYVCDCWLG